MKRFTCACGSSFAKRRGLDQHVGSKKDSLRCSCNTPFKTRRDFESHARAQGHVSYHAEETTLRPPPVKSTPAAKSLLAKESKHQCNRCSTKKSFSSAIALSDHLNDKHKGDANAAPKEVANNCPLCDRKNFSSAKGVLDHIDDKHQGERKVLEPSISSRTRSKADPSKTPRQTPSNAATVRRFCCSLCGRRFATQDGLGHHAAFKHKEIVQMARQIPDGESTQPSDGDDAESLVSDTSDASSCDEEDGGVGLVSLEPSASFDWFNAFNEESGEPLIEYDGWSCAPKP